MKLGDSLRCICQTPTSFVLGFGSHPGNVSDQGPENGLSHFLVVFCFCSFYCYLFNKLILSEFSKSSVNSRETANSQTNKNKSSCQLLLLSFEWVGVTLLVTKETLPVTAPPVYPGCHGDSLRAHLSAAGTVSGTPLFSSPGLEFP